MKIGITTDILRNIKTGVEEYTVELINHLAANFPEDEFFIIREKDRHQEFKDFKSFETKKRIKFFGSRFFYSLLANPDTFKGFDLIHCPTHEAPFFRKLKTKTVATIHDLTPLVLPEEQKFNRVFYFKYFLKPLLRNFDGIIADSFSTKNDLMKFFGIPEEKISVVYLGVSERFKPQTADPVFLNRWGLEPGYIFFMGTIEPRKNIVRLLGAFEKIRQKFKIKLVIAGGLGWQYQKIYQKILASKDVVFLGYVPDEYLPALYNGARIFVYPSLYEGFGLPVLEAMASGLPVITSNTSSLKEIAIDAAILINPLDTEALEREMSRLISSENLQKELAEKTLKQAQKFSWDKTAAETYQVYQKVLNR